jgi:hypothetical protein
MSNLNDTIATAMAAAQALTQNAQNAAGAVVTTANTNTAVAPAGAPGVPMNIEDSINGMSVDCFLKLKFEGIYVKEDATPFEKLHVTIRGSDIAYHKAVRFGNPATYKRSYDGVREARSGKPWAEVVAQAMAADPKCTGDYDAYDLPMTLTADLVSLLTPGKVLVPAGAVVGYSTAITAGKATKEFIKNVIMKLGKGNLLAGTVTLDKKNTEKGKWGILAFGDVSMWKLVDEDAQQAA